MPTAKLTEKTLAKLKAPDPSGKQTLHWDAELKGFGVLCSGTTNARTFIAQRALPGGRTRRVTVGALAELSLKDARDRAAKLLLDMRTGVDPKAGRLGGARSGTLRETLRETLEKYLEVRGPGLAERSRLSYRALVENYLASWLDMTLRDITPEMVEIRHREIKAEVEARGANTGNATANGAMVALRTLWNFAADRDPTVAQQKNPVSRLKRAWFPVARRERTVGAAELPRFYRAVVTLENRVARDYLLLLLFTGLRRREAAELRWSEVDLVERVIRLPAARTKAGRKLAIPMSDFVYDLFESRRSLGDADWVFPSNSASGHIEEPRHPLDIVAERCGVRVSAHDLRRTFITAAESTEMSFLALKALVNHAIGGDVTEGYVQMTVERLREPAQKVCDKIKALCGVGVYIQNN